MRDQLTSREAMKSSEVAGNDRRKSGLPPKLGRSWTCLWPSRAEYGDHGRRGFSSSTDRQRSRLIHRQSSSSMEHTQTRKDGCDEEYSYSNVSDLNYEHALKSTQTIRTRRVTMQNYNNYPKSKWCLTMPLFALLSLMCASSLAQHQQPNLTHPNDRLDRTRTTGHSDSSRKYQPVGQSAARNGSNYFADQWVALKSRAAERSRFDNITTESTQLAPSAVTIQSLDQLVPPIASSTINQDSMVASASKKKKKMMKKKKKMEKKHKEWKKGKKHKKKKYESKKKKGGMEKKKKGKKEKKKWGMEKKGHKKKGNFKKKKWGHKKKKKKGEKKGKKGHKMLKDKGHKKKGFKKVYHKEEWGKKKKWHDIKREKKWNTKQKKWKKKWQQEKGKKYKGKHMKKYHKKNKHGKKYKKEKKSKFKKHKGEKFKKGHKKKKEEYAKKKEGGKKKKMKKFKKEEKKKKKG